MLCRSHDPTFSFGLILWKKNPFPSFFWFLFHFKFLSSSVPIRHGSGFDPTRPDSYIVIFLTRLDPTRETDKTRVTRGLQILTREWLEKKLGSFVSWWMRRGWFSAHSREEQWYGQFLLVRGIQRKNFWVFFTLKSALLDPKFWPDFDPKLKNFDSTRPENLCWPDSTRLALKGKNPTR